MDLEGNRALLVAALARIPAGDRAALQTVYRLTSAKLFGVVLRILHERSEAEDVLQEVYLTVWRKAGDFDAGRAWTLLTNRIHPTRHFDSGIIELRRQVGDIFNGA